MRSYELWDPDGADYLRLASALSGDDAEQKHLHI